VGSLEFQRLLPNRSDRTAVTAVVTRLYKEILGRAPEPAGLEGWVNYIAATAVSKAPLSPSSPRRSSRRVR